MLPIYFNNGTKCLALIDSGAAFSILHPSFQDLCVFYEPFSKTAPFPKLISASGDNIKASGRGSIQISFHSNNAMFQQSVVVAPTPFDVILGRDFLTITKAVIDVTKHTIQLDTGGAVNTYIMESDPPSTPNPAVGTFHCTMAIESRKHSGVQFSVEATHSGQFEVTPYSRIYDEYNLLIPRCLVTLFKGPNVICLPVTNPSGSTVTIFKDTKAVEFTSIQAASIVCAIGIFEVAGTDASTDIYEAVYPSDLLSTQTPSTQMFNDQLNPNLSPDLKSRMQAHISQNKDLFGSEPTRSDTPQCDEHRIPITPDAQPARMRPYPFNPALTAAQVTEVNTLLQAGIIRPSKSSWAAPALMIKKPNGSFRMCIDYRRLNKVTIKDVYPLPRIQDMLNAINGAQYMSSLDMLKGFYQIPVAEEDRHKTAFSTSWGHFEFNRMPFGLTNAPATFQRLMDTVLTGLVPLICMVYIDDILIFSRTFDQHLLDLDRVFSAVRSANLKLNLSKCFFGFTELKYLGHIISRDGLKPNPETIQSVNDFPVPTNKLETQRFLGLANYYRRFIERFSDIAEPLIALTRGNDKKSFPITGDALASFNALKAALTSTPVLAYADFTKPFILRTDASNIGLGAILQQQAGATGNLRSVVAYASRSLNPAERHYSATEREGLAVVWAVTHFRMYLTGVGFTVETDHAALMSLTTSNQTNSRLVRWALFLQGFDMTVKHRPGQTMLDADCLSRAPVLHVMATLRAPATTPKSPLQEKQEQDPQIAALKTFLLTGELSTDERINVAVVAMAPSASVIEGLVCILPKGQDKTPLVIVPKSLQHTIMEASHVAPTGGHLGFDKVYGAIRLKYFWPQLYQDVAKFVSECAVCDLNRKLTTATPTAPLQPILTATPFEIVATDVAGPLPRTGQGHEYFIIFVDIFTKFAHAYPMHKADASTAASLFMNCIVLQHGPPGTLLSDQGSIYTGLMMEKISQLVGYKRSFTSAYHPQTNGTAERFNKTLKHMLMKFIDSNQQDWDLFIQMLVFAYNTTPHASTGVSPFYLLYGRHPHTPIDRMLGLPNLKDTPREIATYITRQHAALVSAHDTAREHLHQAAESRADRFNAAHAMADYQVGDLVYLHTPVVARGLSKKFASPWRGPFKIVQKINDSLYNLEGSKKPVNVARLRISKAPGPQVDASDDNVLYVAD